MFRDRKLPFALMFATAVATCTSEPPGSLDSGLPPSVDDAGVIDTPTADAGFPPGFAESAKSNLRFKRNERIRNDFARALELTPSEVCLEFGQYSCTDTVHTVTLGGVEPYVLGLNVALSQTTATTPIAAERAALYGCERRVQRDLDAPTTAIIYAGLPLADGKLANVEAAQVTNSLDRLYKRALQRAPTERELDHHRQLYRDLDADGQPNPARDWAILSCFSVLTTMESLFY